MLTNMKKLFHPAVGLWLVFSLICGFVVSQSQFTADMSAFLPRHPSPRQQILIDQISEGFASRALIVGVEGVAEPVLSQISQLMGVQLKAAPDFSSVNNGQTDNSEKDQTFLFNNRYLLSPAVVPSRMTVEGLRAAIQESLAELGSSTGLFSKSLLGRDPTGESLEVMKRVIPASQPAQSGGVWMNAAHSRALLLLQTKAQGSDLDAQQAAHAAIEQSFAVARAKLGAQADGAVLKYSGPSVFAVSARDTIKSEAARLSTIGTVMVLGLLWLIYRSVATLCLGMLPVVTGAIAGIAAVGLGFKSIHGMTLGFGITLIGEAVDYAIYLFVQYMPATHTRGDHSSSDQHRAFAESFWPTIRLGVLTSVFGFSTLLLSGFTGLAQLGLFSIIGIVVAALVTRYVLPVLLPHNFSVRRPERLGYLLTNIVAKLNGLKMVVVALTAIALITLIARWGTMWSAELGGLSPVSGVAQKLDEQLRADLGAPDAGLLIVLKATSSEQALQLSEDVSVRLEALVTKGQLAGFQAPSNYLPSQRMQLARKASLPSEEDLQRRITQALQGLPLKSDKLADFFADITQAKNTPLLTRDSLKGTSLSLGLDALLMQNSQLPNEWTALIALQAPAEAGTGVLSASAISDVLSDIGKQNKTAVYVTEIGVEAENVYSAYLREAIALSASGFCAIVLLLLITLRSWRRTVRVVMPMLAAVAIVAAGVVLFKGSLNLLHLVGLLLVVAIGSNYALFFDQRSRNKAADPANTNDHNMLCSLFFANLTTVLGFGLLAFSSVPVMNAIGLTVGVGTFLALVLAAVFASRPSTIPNTIA
jgi:predicted exporter